MRENYENKHVTTKTLFCASNRRKCFLSLKKSSPVIKSFPCFALTQLHCSSSSCRAAYRPAVVYEAVKRSSLVPRDMGILPAGWHTPQCCGHSAANRHWHGSTLLPGEADIRHCCSRTSVHGAHAYYRTSSCLREKGALGWGDSE